MQVRGLGGGGARGGMGRGKQVRRLGGGEGGGRQ